MSKADLTPEQKAMQAKSMRHKGQHQSAAMREFDAMLPDTDEHGNETPVVDSVMRRQVKRGREAMLSAWLVERGVVDQIPSTPGELQRAVNCGHPELDKLPDSLVDTFDRPRTSPRDTA